MDFHCYVRLGTNCSLFPAAQACVRTAQSRVASKLHIFTHDLWHASSCEPRHWRYRSHKSQRQVAFYMHSTAAQSSMWLRSDKEAKHKLGLTTNPVIYVDT